MEAHTSYKPSLQITSFKDLEDTGFISNLSIRKTSRGTYYWKFNLEEFYFETSDGHSTQVDFRKYVIEVCYTRKSPPKVFIIEPKLITRVKHIYKDGSLCLYKPSNWQWHSSMVFSKDLFPNICTWIYFYEIWRDTGEWIGEEASHDFP